MKLRHCVFGASIECKEACEKAIKAYKHQVFDWEQGAEVHGYYPPFKFEEVTDSYGLNLEIYLSYDGEERFARFHETEFIRECMNYAYYRASQIHRNKQK